MQRDRIVVSILFFWSFGALRDHYLVVLSVPIALLIFLLVHTPINTRFLITRLDRNEGKADQLNVIFILNSWEMCQGQAVFPGYALTHYDVMMI